jgi:superfamily II DNA or RNA helicase
MFTFWHRGFFCPRNHDLKIVLSQSVFSYKSSSWPQAANWSEIDDFLAEVNGKDRRAAGEFLEAFCHGYLVTQKGVKDQFANVWPSRGVPETVRDSLNLNKTDIGVDLVAQFHDGRFATIQCKYTSINEKKTLNWTSDRISSWLAASSNAEALLLFTNAESLDPYSRLKANEKDFRIVNEGHLSALTSDEISAILSFIQSTSHSQINQSSPQVTPRPYQIDAISQVLTGFQNASRGKLILPCGAGKTLTAKWIKDRLEPRLTLVLVPSLALLAQFRWSWSDHAERDENYFCVCSEKDIAAGRDESGIEIEEIGTRVTTDPHLIRTLIQHAKTDLVIYSTYQSSPRIAEALSGTGIVFDLAICDEAHRTAGSKTGSFATVHAEAIPIKKRLYMTATPRIVAKILKEKLGPRYQYLADMNDESIYGPEFYRMSFSEAIELEILVDYQIVVIGVSDSEVQNAIARRRWVLEDATAEAIAQNFALHKAMQTYGFTHAVTFHNSIANAKNFTARHEKYFSEASAYHINGTFSSTERAKLLNRFAASSKASISNSRCLTEGVDLPAIDAVMFCDPKTSKTDIVQAAGRALRKDKNKPSKVGYIVVPVFHRNEETVDSAIENGIFGHLISIVRALADHDSRLEDEITQISLGLGKRRQPQSRIVITEGAPKILEIQGFTDKLKKAVFSQIIEKTVIPWLVQIEHLKAYRKRFPDKWPSATQCYPKGNNLGGWVNKVRNDFKKSKLEAEKIAALDSLNFVWESDFDRRNRLAAEEKQKQFIKLEADRLLKEQLAEEKRMLREAAAELERESDRQSMLKLQAEREERDWQIHFGRLESYRRNAVVKTAEPLNYYRNDETVDLTAWLALQRKLFNEKKLSPDRASCLEELGFPLSPTKEQYEHAAKSERLEQIEQLRRFRIENPLEKWITSTFEYPLSNLLGKFVAETRKEHRLKLVDSATLAVFSELGFELNYSYENELIRRRDAKNGDWNQQFKILKKFIEEDPRRPFPSGSVEYPIGNPLGKWCSRQRQKNTILTADQRKLLESINFNFVRDAASDDPRLWDYHIREIRKAIGNTQIEASEVKIAKS